MRLYFFVMYNLSGIQKGIQAGHAALEYALEFGKTKQYKEFINKHKTFIVLDGGGSNDMLERELELEGYGIKYATFIEPDLNDSVSAIAFLVPESIYNKDIRGLEDVYTKDVEFARYLKSFRLASN